MLYQRMMKEKQKVEDRINDLQSQIDVLPSGTFFFSDFPSCYGLVA